MGKNIPIMYQIYSAILIGLLGTYLWSQILKLQSNIDFSDFFIIYTSLAVFLISRIGCISKWWWALWLMISTYLSGYYFIKYWGQFGPFDLLFMFFYILPSIGVAYLLEIFKIKSGTLKKKLSSEYAGFFLTIFIFIFFLFLGYHSKILMWPRGFFIEIGIVIALLATWLFILKNHDKTNK